MSANTIADPTYNVYAILSGTPGALFPDSPRLVRLLDRPTFNAYRSGSQTLAAGEFLATTPFGVNDFPFTSETEFRRPAFKYLVDATWGGDQILSGGYDYERESDPTNPTYRVTNNAFFVQQQFKLQQRWLATVGVRMDQNSRYGTHASPKLSLGGYLVPYRAGGVSSVKVFSNIGRGIKNPTFGELYGSAFTDGNPALHPEQARTIDGGVEATFGGQRYLARATYFDNRFNDQVAFKSTGPSLDGKAGLHQHRRFEGERMGDRGRAAATDRRRHRRRRLRARRYRGRRVRQHQRAVPAGSTFAAAAEALGHVRASYSRGRATVNFNTRYVGQRHDAAFLGLSIVAVASVSDRHDRWTSP